MKKAIKGKTHYIQLKLNCLFSLCIQMWVNNKFWGNNHFWKGWNLYLTLVPTMCIHQYNRKKKILCMLQSHDLILNIFAWSSNCYTTAVKSVSLPWLWPRRIQAAQFYCWRLMEPYGDWREELQTLIRTDKNNSLLLQVFQIEKQT